ncbi:hypothetical protein I3843_04G071500 [Carya illinoinensis]|nr:hypothetical protein I3843_04G071500 [Carya illinoinensis]
MIRMRQGGMEVLRRYPKTKQLLGPNFGQIKKMDARVVMKKVRTIHIFCWSSELDDDFFLSLLPLFASGFDDW